MLEAIDLNKFKAERKLSKEDTDYILYAVDNMMEAIRTNVKEEEMIEIRKIINKNPLDLLDENVNVSGLAKAGMVKLLSNIEENVENKNKDAWGETIKLALEDTINKNEINDKPKNSKQIPVDIRVKEDDEQEEIKKAA